MTLYLNMQYTSTFTSKCNNKTSLEPQNNKHNGFFFLSYPEKN